MRLAWRAAVPARAGACAQPGRAWAAIARDALSFARPGSAIGLSAGTTTWALAKLMSGMQGLKVVTNSLLQFHLNTLFLGVHGVDEEPDSPLPNLLEAETNRVFAPPSRTRLPEYQIALSSLNEWESWTIL